MKKLCALFVCFVALAASAQTPAKMLDMVLDAFNRAGTVTADYSLQTPDGTTSGTVTMQGKRFRILSNDVKCWYDGTTQWAYSPVTGEVNITTPTDEDLQLSNPYAAAQGLKRNCRLSQVDTRAQGIYTLRMQPKDKSQIKDIYLFIYKATRRIHVVRIEMADGKVNTLTIKGYKTHLTFDKSPFTYDASQVPAGTEVVDLR